MKNVNNELNPQLNENSLNQISNIKLEPQHLIQIDIIKALMILLVIVDHTFPVAFRYTIGHSFWERISIPIFLILLGFNSYLSLKKAGPLNLRHLYSKQYLIKKFRRYFFPFAILYFISTIVGILLYGGDWNLFLSSKFDPNYARFHLFFLLPPFSGPGDWFLPVLFMSIFLIPIFAYFFEKSPKITLLCSYLIEFGLQFVINLIFRVLGVVDWEIGFLVRYSFLLTIFPYLSAICTGFWLGYCFENGTFQQLKDKINNLQIKSKRQFFFIWLLFSIILILIPNINYVWKIGGIIGGIWLFILIITEKESKESIVSLLFITIGLILTFITVIWFTSLQQDENMFLIRSIGFILAVIVFFIPLFLNIFTRKLNYLSVILMMVPMSIVYLGFYQNYGLRFVYIIGDYNYLVFPYSCFLILLFLIFFPDSINNSISRCLTKIGQASYHILLTQIFYFGIIESQLGIHYFMENVSLFFLGNGYSNALYYIGMIIYLAVSWLICIPLGYLWYSLESRWFIKRKEKFD